MPAQSNGGLFLAVCRGKVSEGIDFADDNARAVVMVGIPFPSAVDLKVKLKKTYNNEKAQSNSAVLNGSSWYSLQAFRALNQAIGRCIRHRADYGAILFFDERFLEERNVLSISKWIRPSIVNYMSMDDVTQSLSQFFSSKIITTSEDTSSPTSAKAGTACCGACGRKIVEGDISKMTMMESSSKFTQEMYACWTKKKETVKAFNVPLQCLFTNISRGESYWIAEDGQVYRTLICQCSSAVGWEVIATDRTHQNFLDQCFVLEVAIKLL